MPLIHRNGLTAALDTAHYFGPSGMTSDSCGECYEIRGPDAAITVMVADQCPAVSNAQWCSGDVQHFDLAAGAFDAIANPDTGVVPLTFRKVPCPFEDTMKAYVMDGSNAFWMGIIVFAHRVGIRGVDARPTGAGDTAWVTLQRTDYNAWVYQPAGGLSSGTVDLRVTSVDGQVLVANGQLTTTPLQAADLGVQFSAEPVTGMCN